MKKKLSLLALAAVTCCLGMVTNTAADSSGGLSGTVVSGDAKYQISIFFPKGVVRTNANWSSWATPTTRELFDTKAIAHQVPVLLDASFVSQPIPTYDKEGMWVATRIVGVNGAKLNLSMIRFRQMSSDISATRPWGTLSNQASLAGNIYTAQVTGVIWGAGGANGPRSEQRIFDSGQDGTELVDEVVTVGLLSKYYTYANNDQYTGIVDYIRNVRLVIDNVVEVVGTDGAVLGLGARSIQAFASSGLVTLTSRLSSGNIILGATGEANEAPFNVTLYSSSSADTNALWTATAIFSSSQEFPQPAGGTMKYYRASRH